MKQIKQYPKPGKKMPSSRRQPRVILFARQPCLGQVKTRLGRDIGALAAWQFYRFCLSSLCRRLSQDQRWKLLLAITPDSSCHRARLWPPTVARYPQKGGNLGQRMRRFLSLAGPQPVIILGTDAPEVTPDHIIAAWRSLGRYDVVLGPAFDGGYWLIGVRHARVAYRLFHNVRWSTPYALQDTLTNLDHRWKAGFLQTLSDIDDGQSYHAWKNRSPKP